MVTLYLSPNGLFVSLSTCIYWSLKAGPLRQIKLRIIFQKKFNPCLSTKINFSSIFSMCCRVGSDWSPLIRKHQEMSQVIFRTNLFTTELIEFSSFESWISAVRLLIYHKMQRHRKWFSLQCIWAHIFLPYSAYFIFPLILSSQRI